MSNSLRSDTCGSLVFEVQYQRLHFHELFKQASGIEQYSQLCTRLQRSIGQQKVRFYKFQSLKKTDHKKNFAS